MRERAQYAGSSFYLFIFFDNFAISRRVSRFEGIICVDGISLIIVFYHAEMRDVNMKSSFPFHLGRLYLFVLALIDSLIQINCMKTPFFL